MTSPREEYPELLTETLLAPCWEIYTILCHFRSPTPAKLSNKLCLLRGIIHGCSRVSSSRQVLFSCESKDTFLPSLYLGRPLFLYLESAQWEWDCFTRQGEVLGRTSEACDSEKESCESRSAAASFLTGLFSLRYSPFLALAFSSATKTSKSLARPCTSRRWCTEWIWSTGRREWWEPSADKPAQHHPPQNCKRQNHTYVDYTAKVTPLEKGFILEPCKDINYDMRYLQRGAFK